MSRAAGGRPRRASPAKAAANGFGLRALEWGCRAGRPVRSLAHRAKFAGWLVRVPHFECVQPLATGLDFSQLGVEQLELFVVEELAVALAGRLAQAFRRGRG